MASSLCFVGVAPSSASSIANATKLRTQCFQRPALASSWNRSRILAPSTVHQQPAKTATLKMAAEASSSSSPSSDEKSTVGKTTFFIVLWYFFNVLFNIVNKKCLNMWSYPWTLSTVQLGVGALYCAVQWILGTRIKPKVSLGLIKAMFLPALGHTLGHVTSCISFSLVAISFTHIVKSAEPAVGALAAAVFLGETYSLPVYLSLIPICLGVALSSASELTFTVAGFATAMASNFAFAMRNVFSKITMTEYKSEPTLTPANSYGLITIMSFLMELPFCLIFDKGIPALTSRVPGIADMVVLKYILASSLLYHLYNEVSYSALENISPITFSVANTIKRVIIILTSIIVFKTKILPLNAIGSITAVLGTFLYSYTKSASNSKK